jgi:Zn-dependent protease
MPKKKQNALWALIVKLGVKILPYLTKLLKFTKLLKVGLAAASFASYAYMFTWKFAILIMIALAWHESGHVWAMRQMGIKTKGFYFIPFIGGAAIAEESAKTYGAWIFISIMGPVWGLFLALVSCGLYYSTGLPIFAASASFMALINLFNLFPVNPLDGGQIVRSIAFSIHKNFGFVFLVLSLFLGAVLMYKLRIGLFGFILILGLVDLLVEFFKRKNIAKKVAEFTEEAAERRECANIARDRGRDIDEACHLRQEARLLEKILSLRTSTPISMDRKQLTYSLLGYVGTIVFALVIIRFMAHIPGASLANEFLAEK